MTPARESPAPIASDSERTAGEPAALPVLASRAPAAVAGRTSRVLSRDGEPRSLPAVQAAAVAAGSFVAGAAVAGLVHRRARATRALAQGGRDGAATRVGRALSRSSRKGNRAGAARAGHELVQIVGSRTLLVDVHLLGVPDSDR
jgi:hypothetical protein